jgi:DNA modification methylase
MTVRILVGDVLARLRDLADGSVHCVTTSPPYYGLRDYQIPMTVWGGDPTCAHAFDVVVPGRKTTGGTGSSTLGEASGGNGISAEGLQRSIERQMHPAVDSAFCSSCGAWRGCLGMEPTPDLFVTHMVEVFREIRRVLRDDGVLWLNLGDSYASAPGQATRGGPPSPSSTLEGNGHKGGGPKLAKLSRVGVSSNKGNVAGDIVIRPGCGALKPKDMLGIPWRVAFALQADGWYLRQWLPWVKRNPMPESTKDRPTVACETVFMLTKAERYFYDFEAVKRASSPNTHARISQKGLETQAGSARANGGSRSDRPMKPVVSQPRPKGWAGHEGAHGSFHRDGREPGITRPKRVEPDGMRRANSSFENATCHEVLPSRYFRNADLFFDSLEAPFGLISDENGFPIALDVTPQPFKDAHFATFPSGLIDPLIRATCPVGGTVLDPFGGAGTTGLVATMLNREAVLIEINPDYAEMAERRIAGGGMFADVRVEVPA